MTPTNMYREGGWGWMIVLSAFVSEVITYGSLKGLSVLVVAMKEDLDTDLWLIGSIDSLYFGVQFVLTPLASSVAGKVGSRLVAVFGGLLSGIGFLLCMTTYNVALIATSIVLVSGTGFACTVVPIRSSLAFYFREKFPLASFVGLCGAPVGMIVYGPVTQILLDTYGWRGTMLLMGGLGTHLTWCGMLVRRPREVYAEIPKEPEESRRRFPEAVGLDILTDCRFILVACSRMLYNVSYGGVMVYLVSNGLALGLGPGRSAYLTTAFGAGSLAGLALAASVLQTTAAVPAQFVAAAAGCLASLSLVLCAYVEGYAFQLANSFAVGLAVHAVIQVVSVMERALPFPDDRFVLVLGWMSFFSGVATSVGDVATGWLHHVTGGFHSTFTVHGVFMFGCALVLLVHYLYQRRAPNTAW